MVLFRRLLGDVLRRHRLRQSRTLRDVAGSARISLGYLSEIERGRKEASSELLASLCEALGISLADVLSEVSYDITRLERGALAPVGFTGPGDLSRPVPVRPVASLASNGSPLPVASAAVAPAPVGAQPVDRLGLPVAAA